ncbi:hypothetical protein Peur_015791 [Populus x canadensis]
MWLQCGGRGRCVWPKKRGKWESGSPVVWSWPRTRGRQLWPGERKKRKNIRGGPAVQLREQRKIILEGAGAGPFLWPGEGQSLILLAAAPPPLGLGLFFQREGGGCREDQKILGFLFLLPL